MEALEQTLRGILSPITHNLPPQLRDVATQILGPKCYKSLIYDITITDATCLKLAISKALGIAIIGASSIVKIPQLLKLLNSQSAEGISFLSYLLETTSYLVTLVYNIRNLFPFSTYGEIILIAIQNIVISVLVLQYSGKGAGAAVFVAGLAAAGYALFNESVTSLETLQYLQAGAGLLGVASKLPQIITIFSEGTTGQLSSFAVSYPAQNLNYRAYCLILWCTGLQLSRWLSRSSVHHPSGSSRQAYPLRFHRRILLECSACHPDGVLLEQHKKRGKEEQKANISSQGGCQRGYKRKPDYGRAGQQDPFHKTKRLNIAFLSHLSILQSLYFLLVKIHHFTLYYKII
jgi:mannose-P-dolichol utilization defect protein 1